MDKNGKLNIDSLLHSKLEKDIKKQNSIEAKTTQPTLAPVVAKQQPLGVVDISKLMTESEQAQL